ncbi:MAG: alcohol dehydrogenase catalytic domain-containing protein [Anaerolineales bacterium]|nr:alcohol dehydrogenase catalytic domain-containing protein [Anaerolineales bacterium]
MNSIWLQNNQISLREVPIPTPPLGEALVRVRLAGICATDLELVKGYYPYNGILGHEFVGEIVDAPDAPPRVGQRVVGEINAVCGKCATCKRGNPTHCENRTVLGIANRNGAFAEYTTLPLENLIPVPDAVPDEMAVFTEPLAAALEIQEQVLIKPTDRVLLVGAGRLGQLIAYTLKLTGCDLRVVTRHASQRNLLEGKGVACIHPEELPVRKMDLVVEATGSPAGFELARKAVRPRGTVVLKSTYAGRLTLDVSAVVVDEITLIGSRCGPFAPALRLMEQGLVDPRLLINAHYPLSEGIAAFACAEQGGVFKVLLRP